MLGRFVLLRYLIGLVIAYALCGIPFSLIFGKVFFNLDLREYGSGNLGATNTLRTLGLRASMLVLILDCLKGFLSIVLMRALIGPLAQSSPGLFEAALLSTMLIAELGHIFSPYIGFRGGKGVATAAGCLLALQPLVVPICLALFLVIAGTSRYVSLGSISIAIAYPFLVLIFYHSAISTVFAFVIGGLIVYMHRANIARLRAGTEPKVSLTVNGGSSKPKE